MDQQERLDVMEKGRVATAVSAAIGGYIDEEAEKVYVRIMSLYRSGQIDHDLMVGAIGELVALDNLRHALEYDQRRGDIAADKELGNAEGQ